MPVVLLTPVEYGGYISIAKFVVFVILFFLWLPLVAWVYRDARAVGVERILWTGIVFGAGAAATIIWLAAPFIVGIFLYLIAVTAASLAYVKQRNAKVLEYDRVLTVDHIKTLLSSRQKSLDALKGFVFITANKNEVPLPQPKTPDFFGYKTAQKVLTDAIWRRASDVMFSPTHQEYKVAYQIDGAITRQPSIPRDQMDYLVRFLKNLGDLDTNEKRKPQKGNFRTLQGERKTDWEVTTAGSTVGEQVLLKQLMQQRAAKLADIGLAPDQFERLDSIRRLKKGLFLVSGPRKSGVTTTFYALLRNHDAFVNSINTLEKELSAELPNITQNLFTLTDTGTTTFDSKLQAIIRMGPDIVGVAGSEDAETAQTVCKAAKESIIVYMTLSAENAIKALGKWVKLVGDKALAVGPLLGISNQRVLRQLCEDCKQAYTPNQELLRKFGIPPEKAKVLHRPGKVIYDKRGKERMCEYCQGTGFVGRTGIFETVIMNEQLRKAVIQSKSLSEIGAQLRAAKMLYMQEQALRKVVDGTTAVNEMVRVFSESKKHMRKR
ncbi:MAG: GspE/PulE family protein [Planctomycetota bacterium]|jgi:type II secretory ATPase GspE/PulE/Tfp pilus assembly ATPase PilB-like protein